MYNISSSIANAGGIHRCSVYENRHPSSGQRLVFLLYSVYEGLFAQAIESIERFLNDAASEGYILSMFPGGTAFHRKESS